MDKKTLKKAIEFLTANHFYVAGSNPIVGGLYNVDESDIDAIWNTAKNREKYYIEKQDYSIAPVKGK